MTLPIQITTLTPATVQQQLQSDGLDALGLTTLKLSPRWTDAAPGAYDPAALTLFLSTVRAPFRGILEYAFPAATAALAADLAANATTLTVVAGAGSAFPTPAGGSVLLTLAAASGSKREVVECTGRAGDAFTIVREAMGTTRQAFAAGDRVTLRLAPSARASAFVGSDGVPLAQPCAVFRPHPQVVHRLETLVGARYAAPGAPRLLPAPWAMVVRGVQGFASPQWFEADALLPGAAGPVSFHDGRGLIVDPTYVAALFDDLQTWLAGLVVPGSMGTPTGVGGVRAIAGLAPAGTLVHCTDPHGNVYQPALAGATLITQDASNNVTGTVPTSGLVTLAPGDGIAASVNDLARLRWGWAVNGTLARTRLAPPPLPAGSTPPVSLPRQFYRLTVVDTTWAFLGNRGDAAVLGIDGDDATMPDDLLPVVRDQVAITYLADGPDVLAQAATVLARPSQNMVLAVSPVIDGAMGVPAAPGGAAHWPLFPGPNSGAGFPAPPTPPLPSPQAGIAAAWRDDGPDVVVTIAPNAAPDGAHVRLYPQQFVTIDAIAGEPSFVRGHGGAAVAASGAPTAVLLTNPFTLASGQPRPSPATLTVDVVIAPRMGARRLWAAVAVPVGAGPTPAPADPFGGGNTAGAVPPIFQSVAPVPLFGVPTTVTPPGAAPGGVVAFVRALASETAPRQGPRLPTMARFETVVVTGTTGGTPAGSLLWEAVLSGGRWARETRSALHASGNPGNPPGPDVHAAGVHVTGALAYDLARHAMRRAMPIVPLVGPLTLGWAAGMAGDNFDPPQDALPANTGIGALLETVAAVCESPELSEMTPPDADARVQDVVNAIAAQLEVDAPTVSVDNEPRLVREVRREFYVAASGARDAAWSLRRALREARELVYVESPQFSRTSRVGGSFALDLVAELVAGIAAHPNLRVVVCTPREADFAPSYRGWSRQHFQARSEAVGDLLNAAPDRVAVFHPAGFPGRPAFVRTTSVVVDDVWCLVGATHWRRRGLTFDGSAAIASMDGQLDGGGYSTRVRAFRRALMAAKLGVAAPGTGVPGAEWMRLGRPAGAFELVADLLRAGGLGRIQPLWPGPSDSAVQPATPDMADPDGSNGATFVGAFTNLIAELGD